MAEVPSNPIPASSTPPEKIVEKFAGKTADEVSKLTAQQLHDRLRKELALVTKQLASEKNFGPGKPGRVKWQVPRFPKAWKVPDLKTVNAVGKTIYHQGAVYELTFDEIEDLTGRYGTRVMFEDIARHGGRELDIDAGSAGGFLF
jgi:hypothetical protein